MHLANQAKARPQAAARSAETVRVLQEGNATHVVCSQSAVSKLRSKMGRLWEHMVRTVSQCGAEAKQLPHLTAENTQWAKEKRPECADDSGTLAVSR